MKDWLLLSNNERQILRAFPGNLRLQEGGLDFLDRNRSWWDRQCGIVKAGVLLLSVPPIALSFLAPLLLLFRGA